MLFVIFILATDTVDATVFASRMLGISASTMTSECKAITTLRDVPHSCRGLDVRATPQFFERMMTPGEKDEARPTPPRQLTPADGREVVAARGIRTAVRLRGGEIKPPYDLPKALDPESIEAWLAEG